MKNYRTAHRNLSNGFTLIEGIIAVGVISSALIVGLTLAVSNLSAAQANSDRIIAGHLAREGVEVVRNIRDSNWMRRDANIDRDSGSTGTQFFEWFDFYDKWPTEWNDASVTCDTGNPDGCYVSYLDIIMSDEDAVSDGSDPVYTLKEVGNAPVSDALLPCVSAGTDPACKIQKKNGIYYQASTITGDSTPFYRRIFLQPICLQGGTKQAKVIFDTNFQDSTGLSRPMLCADYTPLDTMVGDNLVGVLVTSHVMWQRGSKIREIKVKERLYDWRDFNCNDPDITC
jgi:type II secretory pathway pseudopilin PulG